MTPDQIANQTLLAAWVAAGAAVAQALGAVAAIWATIRLARKAEARAAEAESAAVKRAEAAETASIARAENAEAVALQRSAIKDLIRRRRIAQLVWSEALKLVHVIELEGRRTSNGGTFTGQPTFPETEAFLSALALAEQKTEDFDLLEEMAAVRGAVRGTQQAGSHVARTPAQYAAWHSEKADQIRDAIERLKNVAAGPFIPS